MRWSCKRTQDAYISAVAQLARHYRRSPDTLSGAEIEGKRSAKSS